MRAEFAALKDEPTVAAENLRKAARWPVLVALLAFCISLALWPAQKNLGTLLSCSAAVMLADSLPNAAQSPATKRSAASSCPRWKAGSHTIRPRTAANSFESWRILLRIA